MADATALYRFYDKDERLLYVGITRNPPARFSAHGQDKDWWQDVGRIDMEWHPTRRDALQAEEAAIKAEGPLYNVVHSIRQRAREIEAHGGWQPLELEEALAEPDTRLGRWKIHHAACDPNVDADAYTIRVERIKNLGQVIHWTAHLMEKRWFHLTDWDSLLWCVERVVRRTDETRRAG